jgi:hypothetical protein
VGRNQASAEALIASFPKPTVDAAVHEFVFCDARYMRNVRSAAKGILSRVSKINFLVMSQGYMTSRGRDETDEGIDKKLAVHYYSRWTFLDELIPALNAAKKRDEDAKVLTVLAAGTASAIDLNDLGLKKNFTTYNAAMQAPTYNDLMIEVSFLFMASCLGVHNLLT